MLRWPSDVFFGFNVALTHGVRLSAVWMFFRVCLCFMSSGCSTSGVDIIQFVVLGANIVTILSATPAISVLGNFIRRWADDEQVGNSQLVTGLMGGILIHLFLEDWKAKSMCMRELKCPSPPEELYWGSAHIFYYLQTQALEYCGNDTTTGCFRGVINFHWIGITVVTFFANYALAHYLLSNTCGEDARAAGDAPGEGPKLPHTSTKPTPNCSCQNDNTRSQAHLRERVHQSTVSVLRDLGNVVCPECRDSVNEVIDNSRQ